MDGFRIPERDNLKGRPYVYPVKVVVKAFLVMVFLKLNSVRSLSRVLASNPKMAQACGLGERLPSYRTLTRRFKTLESPVADFVRQLVQVLVRYHLISLRMVSTDSSLIEAQGKAHQKKRKTKSKKLPETKPSDPDAAWGWSRSRDWVFGYKIHLTSTVLVKERKQTLVPLVWEVSSANRHDSRFLLLLMKRVRRLADASHRRIRYSLADKGYDSQQAYLDCQQLNLRLITSIREMKNRYSKPIKLSRIKRSVLRFLKTPKGRQLYQRRADVERLFGHLKDLFLIDPLPVKRLVSVRPYLALVNLAYLLAVFYNHLNGRSLREIKSLVV